MPGLVEIEAALQEHQERAERADQHDGPQAEEEGQQSVGDHQTITLPSSVMAFSRSSSVKSSPISIWLWASPLGIIGKQLTCLSTRQSKITGRLTAIISRMASSSSDGFSARMPNA